MINMEKILPELMDWKAVEKASEDGIRQAEIAIALHNLARTTAKIQIKKLNGMKSFTLIIRCVLYVNLVP